jgi:PAS domain S-box-containing protein
MRLRTAGDAPEERADQSGRGRGPLIAGLVAVVVAVVMPVSAIFLAGQAAEHEVSARAMAGDEATAAAVATQVDQSYQSVLATLERSPSGPSTQQALRTEDAALARSLLGRLVAAYPVSAVSLTDASGNLLASVPSAAAVPADLTPLAPGVSEGPLVETATSSIRAVVVTASDAAGHRIGTLTADIDVSRLVADGADLRFDQTGKSALVGVDGRDIVDGDPNGVGRYLQTPSDQRLARAHAAATLITYSSYYHQRLIEAYVPVPGQPWGVLTSQSTGEAFQGVNALRTRLAWLALLLALLGCALAGGVWVMLRRRDRRNAAQTLALAQARELFQSAFDDAPTGVALIGLDGRYLQVNRSLCAMTGRSEEELLAASFSDLSHPDDAEVGLDALAEMGSGASDRFDTEKRYVHADGHVLWVKIRVSVVKDADGRPVHLISHVTDITDRRAAMDALAEANEQLRRANELKDHFVAVTTHELRSPLTSILGFAGLLQSPDIELSEDERAEYLGRIERQGRRLEGLIEDLLTLSSIESGLEVDLQPVPLLDAINESILEVGIKGVDVRCPDDVVVLADQLRLQQILVNLLTNAGKYGEAPFSILAHENSGKVVISVNDRGEGVPPDFAARLFDTFTQASTGRTRRNKGTGLGLAIVRGLAVALGGEVWYEANPGGGSRFKVRLKAATPPQRRELQPASGGRRVR